MSRKAALTPIFLFSLPRSGSTLLQRLLGAHSRIDTRAEVYGLLPLLHLLEVDGVVARYGHGISAIGFRAFLDHVDDGYAVLDDQIRGFMQGLYDAAAAPDADYFIDKTPRYACCAREIVRLFPNARFIFLFRHPLATVASFIDTYRQGRWALRANTQMLYQGLSEMVAAREQLGESAITVRYEDLVENPEGMLSVLLAQLGLAFEPSMLTDFSSRPVLGVGDPKAGERKSVSSGSIDRWKHSLGNPLRRRWCRAYLRFIGAERARSMGYDLDAIRAELDDLPFTLSRLSTDLIDMPFDWFYRVAELPFAKRKLRDLPAGGRNAVHF